MTPYESELAEALRAQGQELAASEAEVDYLRDRLRRARDTITNLATVLHGVSMRGKRGGVTAHDRRYPTRFDAIMRSRELLDDWEKNQ